MKPLDLALVRDFVNANIDDFHRRRIKSLEDMRLESLIRKNPYLFKAKNITVVTDLIMDLLSSFLSSSEEKLFGDFLEELALFIAGHTCEGRKSDAPGIDLDFINNDVRFIVSIKSGQNWGNSSQHAKLAQDFRDAVTRIKQSRHSLNVQPVLGICYGKVRTGYTSAGYLKVVGQNFWYLISENKELYPDIIEPVGYRAAEHNETFMKERDRIINLFTRQFVDRFCTATGEIDWVRLVRFNSGNFDLDQFLS